MGSRGFSPPNFQLLVQNWFSNQFFSFFKPETESISCCCPLINPTYQHHYHHYRPHELSHLSTRRIQWQCLPVLAQEDSATIAKSIHQSSQFKRQNKRQTTEEVWPSNQLGQFNDGTGYNSHRGDQGPCCINRWVHQPLLSQKKGYGRQTDRQGQLQPSNFNQAQLQHDSIVVHATQIHEVNTGDHLIWGWCGDWDTYLMPNMGGVWIMLPWGRKWYFGGKNHFYPFSILTF